MVETDAAGSLESHAEEVQLSSESVIRVLRSDEPTDDWWHEDFSHILSNLLASTTRCLLPLL